MRISDWSSDVCSSDLLEESRHRSRLAVIGAADLRLRHSRILAELLREEGAVGLQRLRHRRCGGGALHLLFLALACFQRALKGRERPHGHAVQRSEEHTSELQSIMRISYPVFCLKKKK